MPEPTNKPTRPFVTDYNLLRCGYPLTVDGAVTAAVRYCVANHARKAKVYTRDRTKCVAELVVTPLGVMVTMHGAWRISTKPHNLKRVA